MTSNLSKSELDLMNAFVEEPNKHYLEAIRVSLIDSQDGTTERWKYILSKNLFVIIDGYLPGPWSSSTAGTFHSCILHEVHIDGSNL